MKLGLKPEETRMRDHDKEELSFYSKATSDIEFLFPFILLIEMNGIEIPNRNAQFS